MEVFDIARPLNASMATSRPVGTSHPESYDRVDPNILHLFPQLVARLGGDAVALLRQVGIEAEGFLSGHDRANYSQTVDLVGRAAEHLNCPDFGMRLAQLQASDIQSPLMGVMQHSATLGEGLEFVASHSYVHSPAASIWLRQSLSEETVSVGHDILLPGLPNRGQAIELLLLLAYLTCLKVTGGLARIRRVHFRHQPVSPLATYRHYFGCEIRFGQCVDAIVFPEQALACPITKPDKQARHEAITTIQGEFRHVDQPLDARVRGAIINLLATERCSNKGVSAELGLHTRSLHRRLTEEGTSFQRIKNEVRCDLLRYYLENTELALADISERLGFAEQSAMTRFCKRWLGVSPTKHRSMAKSIAHSVERRLYQSTGRLTVVPG